MRFLNIITVPILVMLCVGFWVGITVGEIYKGRAVPNCLALANIGYDSVVNHGVGLDIEISLAAVGDDKQFTDIVNRAYEWWGTPHDFAIKIHGECNSNG